MHPHTTASQAKRKYMRVDVFGAVYGPKKTKTYDLIASGKLRAVRLDGMTLIDVESADALFASLPAVELTGSREAA